MHADIRVPPWLGAFHLPVIQQEIAKRRPGWKANPRISGFLEAAEELAFVGELMLYEYEHAAPEIQAKACYPEFLDWRSFRLEVLLCRAMKMCIREFNAHFQETG